MRKISIILTLLLSHVVQAQTINDLRNAFTNNIKSPQLTDFIRYGNVPIKKNIGELDLSIPLLTLPTQNGNDVNISLAYNASGFIPNKKSGVVGYNWSLMAGGVITREVRGEIDELIGSPETLDGSGTMTHFEHGYIAGIRQFGTNTSALPTDNDLNSYNYNKIDLSIDATESRYYEIRFNGYPNNNSTRYETTPDMFSFNFNGISGKFFMAPNGTIEVTTTEPHKLIVDVSGLASQPYFLTTCSPHNLSEIKITDEKGNKYYFGGEGKNLEYSVYLGDDANGDRNSTTGVINSWYLTKVEFQNGDVINYNYQDDGMPLGNFTMSDGFCHRDQNMLFHGSQYDETKKFIEESGYPNEYRRLVNSDQQYSGYEYVHFTNVGSSLLVNNNYSLIKKTYLASIEYKDFKINFVYSDQDNLYKNIFISSNSTYDSAYKGFLQKKIDKIELYNKTSLIQDVTLKYDIYNSTFPRVFLKSIQETGKNAYAFTYDTSNAANTPSPFTRAIDYWGYYNGKTSNDAPFPNKKLIPTAKYYDYGDFEYITNEREPDFNYSKMYALTSVKYPTGGSSIFEYEPHQYSFRLERRLASEFLPQLFNVTGIAGGTRIRKIYDNDSNLNQNIKEFIYTNDNNQSSGILMDWPRYYFYINSKTSQTICDPPGSNHCWASIASNDKDGFIQSTSYSKNLFESSVMNYSKVIEKQISHGSVTDYFTTYIDKPDIFYNNTRQLTAGSYTPMPETQNISLMPNDRSIERGKLYKRYVKDESNNLLEETNISYNEDPLRFNKFHLSVNLSTAWSNTPKTYYYNDFTSSTVTKKYLSNSLLTTTTNYSYLNPSHNMLTKTSVLFPDNSVNETIFNYAHEEGNSYLIGKNIIGVPLVTEITKNNKSLSKVKLNYPIDQTDANKYTSGLPLPKSALSYDLQNIGTSQTELTYDKYDNKGNVLQYTLKNGNATTLIWGYNQTNLIAKIEGATYPDPQNPKPTDISQSLITTLTTASNADAALSPRSDESTFLTALNTFRTDSTLKDYQITTYTYDPLIGVRSITPPSGITEFYKYDTANRLEKILDKDNNILKEYKYSLLTYYNDEQNRPFVRNNCGADYFGESYIYTVSAGAYSSTISKEDANQKAINDINANGQNAANIYGVCNHTCIAIPEDQNSLQSYTSFHEISPNHYLGVVNVTFLEETRFQVSLGSISSCAPNTIKTYTHNDGTRNWTITLNPNGSVILKGPSSYVIPVGQNVSFSFEYDK